MSTRSVVSWIASLALVGMIAGTVHAEITKGVIGAFKGQLVISKDELPTGRNDKDTIAKIKAERVSELVGTTSDEVTAWTFHYAAFLSKTGATKLKMEFYRDGKQYAADKVLDGIDPKSVVLTGTISISEDEGLTKGKNYTIKLTTEKNTVVSQATLLMK